MRKLPISTSLPKVNKPTVVFLEPTTTIRIFIEGNLLVISSDAQFSINLVYDNGKKVRLCENVAPGTYCYKFPDNYKVGFIVQSPKSKSSIDLSLLEI